MNMWLPARQFYPQHAWRRGRASGDWFADSQYDLLSHVADLNNDRYAMPTWGSEVVANGAFTTDTGWTKASNATIDAGGNGLLTHGTTVPQFAETRQDITVTPGKMYALTYTLTRTAGSVKVELNGGATAATTRSASGTYTEYLTAGATTTRIIIANMTASSNYTIDDVSLKEVVLTPTGRTYGSELIVNGDFATAPTYGGELLDNGNFSSAAVVAPNYGTGWVLNTTGGSATATISGGTLNLTGDGSAAAYADQSFDTTATQVYEITFTSSSNLTVDVGTSQGNASLLGKGITNAGGTYTFRFTATGATTWVRFWKTSATLTTVDNATIKSWAQPSGWELKQASTGVEVSTISGGTLNLTGDGTNSAYADQSFATTIGQIYEFAVTSTATISCLLGTSQGGVQYLNVPLTANTSPVFKFTATSTTSWLRFTRQTATLGTIDNVSIRALTALGVYPKREATFAEFFAYTAASDSARTYTDSGGTLRPMTYGVTNLAFNSETFGSWSNSGLAGLTADTDANPLNAAVTADTIQENTSTSTHSVTNSNTAVVYAAATPYTFSVYAKAGTCSTLQIVPPSGPFGTVYANFDLSGGVIGTSGGSPITHSIQSLGSGWYRCSVAWNSTGATSNGGAIFMISSASATRVESYLGTSRTLIVYGWQTEPGTVASPYTATTTAIVQGGVNAPRFTYANAKRQLRLENSGTNVCIMGETPTNTTYWNHTSVTPSSGATAPMGSASARFTSTVAGATAGIGRSGTNAVTASVPITFSGYFRHVSGSAWVRMVLADHSTPTVLANAWFNVQTGVVGAIGPHTGSPTSVSSKITSAGGGWYRCEITATIGAFTTNGVFVRLAGADSSTTAGSIGDAIDVAHLQVEVSAFSTDYIPNTTTGTITRAIETARFHPAVEAVLQRVPATTLVRADQTNTINTASTPFIGFDAFSWIGTGPFTNTAVTSYGVGTVALNATIGGGGVDTDPLGAAAGFDLSGRSFVANGGNVASDAITAPSRLSSHLGRISSTGASNYGDGYYDLVGFSPERLPAANLQDLAEPEPSTAWTRFLSSATDTTDATSYTFASQSLGNWDDVVVAFMGRSATTTVTVSSVTVHIPNIATDPTGTALTAVVQNTNNGNVSAIYSGARTATTGDIKVTLSHTGVRCAIAVYKKRAHTGSPTTATSAALNPTASLTIPTNGSLVGAAITSGTSSSTATNFTEDFDSVIEASVNATSGSTNASTSPGATTYTFTYAGSGSSSGVFAAWGP